MAKCWRMLSFHVKVFFTILEIPSPKFGSNSEIGGCDWKACSISRPSPQPLWHPRTDIQGQVLQPFWLIEFGDFSHICREARRPDSEWKTRQKAGKGNVVTLCLKLMGWFNPGQDGVPKGNGSCSLGETCLRSLGIFILLKIFFFKKLRNIHLFSGLLFLVITNCWEMHMRGKTS